MFPNFWSQFRLIRWGKCLSRDHAVEREDKYRVLEQHDPQNLAGIRPLRKDSDFQILVSKKKLDKIIYLLEKSVSKYDKFI